MAAWDNPYFSPKLPRRQRLEVAVRDMNRALGRIRGRRNDIENHVIDEFMAGRIDRREFFRRGAVVGMSVPVLSAIVTACGGSSGSSSSTPATSGGGGKAGGTLRLSLLKPSTAVDPVLNGDLGG
ncbi:MAG TPA: hypothetical protein VE824_01780, partial [Gaiellales bacterium]|nr:hypothetical protein [Gaiellales bacterium]